jgi:hypothetical protein
MGRKKTLPPSTFVGVLIPNDMLQKIDSMAQNGRKDCSSFSRSEAVRDLLAKSLGVKWKPVTVKMEEEKKTDTVTDKQATRRLKAWADKVRKQTEENTGEHWASRASRVANENRLPYDVVSKIRLTWSADSALMALFHSYSHKTPVELYSIFKGEVHNVR